MALDPTHWAKWTVLSIAQWCKTHLPNEVFYVRGFLTEKNRQAQRYELTYLGPDIIDHTEDSSSLHMVLNCQIATQRTPTNIEEHLLRIGKAQKVLSPCIPIYKYGSDSGIDDKTLFGQLQRISNIETAILGQIDPASTVERSTIEAAYRMEIGS